MQRRPVNSRHATQLAVDAERRAMDALTPLLRVHAPTTSALGLCSPRLHTHRDWAHSRPHLHRDWAQPRPYLNRDWAYPRPHLHQDCAHRAHICAGTGLAFATSAQGLGSLLPHLRRDCARRRNNICTSLWLSATFVIWLCCMISNYSSVAGFKCRYFGGGKSCLVALMALDFGRVINLTRPELMPTSKTLRLRMPCRFQILPYNLGKQ